MRGISFPIAGCLLLAGAWIMLQAYGQSATTTPTTPPTTTADNSETHIPLTITAGHDTDPADRGRPVILIANALGVPPQTFRDAFKNVHPAGPNRGPTEAEARANKAALLKVLAPLGITNDRLDEVSNFYRYRRESAQLWKHTDAQAYARFKNNQLLGFVITTPGAGYSSPPDIQIPDHPTLHPHATLSYTKDLPTNGSLTTIQLDTPTP